MIRSVLLAAAAALTLSTGPVSAADGPSTIVRLGTVRVIVEVDGKQTMALRCTGGTFTIRHNGKGSDIAAAVFEGDGRDGELTSSGIIGCEKP